MPYGTRWNALVVSSLLSLAGSASAQEPLPPPPKTARNNVYLELSTIVFVGSLTMNYERILGRSFSVRAGGGVSYVWAIVSGVGAGGVVVMGNFFTGAHEHHFEAGLGLSYVSSSYLNASVWPSAAIGYRYQQPGGGLFLRAGGSWVLAYGFPTQFSVGYTW